MSLADPKVAAARARVYATKLRLDASVATAKVRLDPRTVASETAEDVRDRAAALANDAADAVRERPAASATIAGLVGLFLLRRPIGRLFGGRRDETPAGTDS